MSLRAARLLSWAGAGTLVGALSLFAWLLFLAPAAHQSSWGWNAPGTGHFRGVFGISAPRLSLGAFVTWLTASLGLAWLGYVGLVVALLRGADLPRTSRTSRTSWILGASVLLWLLALAFVAPPSLSQDIYAYAAYARMGLVHGWNPYAHAPFDLRALGDPITPFLQWNVRCPYGPLWTLLSMGLLAPLRHASLYAQVVVFKLLAAGALVLLARSVAAIAAARDARFRQVAFVAVAFNPLLVIEGPLGGHNDLVVMALFTAGAVALLASRARTALLLVGLSASIKVITFAAVPWLLLHEWRRLADRDRRARAVSVLGLLVVAVAPTLVGQLPFELPSLFGLGGAGSGSFLAGLGDHVAQQARTSLAAALLAKLPLLVAFVLATAWVVRHPGPFAWHAAWIALAVALVAFGARIWFPWYLTWALAFALTRWDRRGLAVLAALTLFGVLLTLEYGFLPGAG